MKNKLSSNAGITSGYRPVMTCLFMPGSAAYNGIQNILNDEQIAPFKVGGLLCNEEQDPLIYSNNH